jgi:hypothetical protein
MLTTEVFEKPEDFVSRLKEKTATQEDKIRNVQFLKMKNSGMFEVQDRDGNVHEYSITNWTHGQLANYTGIPYSYYNKVMSTSTKLLAENVNHWFAQNKDDVRMVRLDGSYMRAFVSDRFKRIDNYDVASIAVSEAKEVTKTIKFRQAWITDKMMNLELIDPTQIIYIDPDKQAQFEQHDPSENYFYKPGEDVYMAGISITNSEVGYKAFEAQTYLYRLSCSNGLVMPYSVRRVHLGGRIDEGDWSGKTRELDISLTESQIRDIVRKAFEKNSIDKAIDELRKAKNEKIPHPQVFVDITAREFGFSDVEKDNIWSNLSIEGDLSKYGFIQAMTRTAQMHLGKAENERKYEMEKIAGTLVAGDKVWGYLIDATDTEVTKRKHKF